MKRKAFLASIFGAFGVARAQQTFSAGTIPTSVFPKKNSECPLCGTVEPDETGRALDCGFYSGHPPIGSGCPGSRDLIRCSKCNIAFWRDVK